MATFGSQKEGNPMTFNQADFVMLLTFALVGFAESICETLARLVGS